jgi:hypothetical protein
MLRKQILSIITAVFVGIAFSGCSNEAVTQNESVIHSSNIQNQNEELKSRKDEETESKSLPSESDNKTKPTTNIVQAKDDNKSPKTVNNNDSKTIDKSKESVKEQTNNDVEKDNKKKVIVIDAGHGGKISSVKNLFLLIRKQQRQNTLVELPGYLLKRRNIQ